MTDSLNHNISTPYDNYKIRTETRETMAESIYENEGKISDNLINEIKGSIIASEYNINWQEGNKRFESPNRENNLRLAYSDNGFSVKPRIVNENDDDWTIEFKTKGIYRKNILVNDANKAVPETFENNQLLYNYNNGLKIEYLNTPDGMRQNFYLSKRADGNGMLECRLEIISSLKPKLINSSTLEIGSGHLLYKDLIVWDKNQQLLNAWFELSVNENNNSELAIIVDDQNAEYPIIIDPLSTTPNKILESDQAYSYFGRSISEAGDINADGYVDLIVGAPNFDNGSSDEGKVFIYHGTAAGFSSTPTNSIELNISSMQFGNSVCYAGDVNSDGFDDVLIGAWKYSGGQSSEGAAYLYMGSPLGISATYAWQNESNLASAAFGYKVAGLGDVNNDGYSDFGIGAYQFNNGQSSEGKIYVYHGEAGVISTTPDWAYEPNITFVNFGYDLSNAGDVNGDGFDDMIAGANAYGDSNQGKAYVFYGSSGGLALSPSWTAEGTVSGGYFGASVNDAGDVNGDGYDDIVIGAYGQSFGYSASGKVYAYYGSSSGLPATPSWLSGGPVESGQYGFSCGSAGDINNDGFDDVMVGAPNVTHSFTDEGAVFIYLGSSGGINNSAQNIIYGQQTNGRIGRVLSNCGDLNNDNYDDIAIGAYEFDNGSSDEGLVFIIQGQYGGVGTTGLFPQLNQVDAGFGSQITELKSENNYYIVVSAPFFDNGNINEGLVNVFGYSDYNKVNPIPTFSIEGNQD
ncbi:MAG: integrin alpha, partial [Chitinophagales bacterium]